MAQETIKFSIIVPVYNAEKSIEKCILSVINQSYRNYELILVNDGSIDNSGDICNQFYCDNIFCFHVENGGQIYARNIGAQKSTGEYILFLDADDYLESNTLEVINQKISSNDIDCVVWGYKIIENGNEVRIIAEEDERVTSDKNEIFLKILTDSNYNAVWRKATKSSIVKDIDLSEYHDLRLGEDLLQTIEIIRRSRNVLFIKDVLYNYVVNPEGVTHNITYSNYRVNFKADEAVLSFIKNNLILSESDIIQYRSFKVKKLLEEIGRIASFDCSKSEKIELLREIYNSTYYQDFLKLPVNKSVVGKKYALFFLFNKRLFSIILLIYGFRNI